MDKTPATSNQPMKLRDAIQRMRTLTELNVPFSFSYFTYSEQLRAGGVHKQVKRALLRSGYREDQSELHNILVAYTDLDNEGSRQFYFPLLATFNGNRVTP